MTKQTDREKVIEKLYEVGEKLVIAYQERVDGRITSQVMRSRLVDYATQILALPELYIKSERDREWLDWVESVKVDRDEEWVKVITKYCRTTEDLKAIKAEMEVGK